MRKLIIMSSAIFLLFTKTSFAEEYVTGILANNVIVIAYFDKSSFSIEFDFFKNNSIP